MPKRPCPDYENDHHQQPVVKKQINSNNRMRAIRSTSSERTLQLLYNGASRSGSEKKIFQQDTCNDCAEAPSEACNYCDKLLCTSCANLCFSCKMPFCGQCSYLTYDHNKAVCVSCYK